MPRKIIAAVLLAALLLGTAGCSAMFKKQYVSVTDYSEDLGENVGGEPRLITDYDELKNAIVSAVSRHVSQDRYKFVGYEGSLRSDLDKACEYVSADTAIGSYAAESISSELSRIITYYEATVYITYKKSEEDIKAITYISGKAELPTGILRALEALDTETVFSMNSSTVTQDDVVWAVFLALAQNPLSSVVLPASTVSIYPETGSTRIVELMLSYGKTSGEIESMRGELSKAAEALINIYGKSPSTLFRALTESCELYSPGTSLGENYGNAYGALVEDCGDSAGIALGYKTLCDKAGAECSVVTGALNGEYRCWNAVKVEGQYLYADAAAVDGSGVRGIFGLTSEQMASRGYQWDKEAYAAEETQE